MIDYPFVTDAPDWEQITDYEEESKRRYKAVDRDGNIFLIQNPALMTYQCAHGMAVITRMRPVQIESARSGGKRWLSET